MVVNELRNGFPQDVRSGRAIAIRKHALRHVHVGIDMLRDLCMQETVLGDAEGYDAVGVVFCVIGVGGTGFHDSFDGVGDEVCETSV